MPTYYEILGCDKNASYEEIKKRYHELVKRSHPDKSKEKSEQEFLDLDKAWKTLRNADTRKEYDLEIAKNDMDEMPLYCTVGLSEMDHNPETSSYSFVCRCGGLYVLNESEVNSADSVKVACDECTFHIDIFLSN